MQAILLPSIRIPTVIFRSFSSWRDFKTVDFFVVADSGCLFRGKQRHGSSPMARGYLQQELTACAYVTTGWNYNIAVGSRCHLLMSTICQRTNHVGGLCFVTLHRSWSYEEEQEGLIPDFLVLMLSILVLLGVDKHYHHPHHEHTVHEPSHHKHAFSSQIIHFKFQSQLFISFRQEAFLRCTEHRGT